MTAAASRSGSWDFEVKRADLRARRVQPAADPMTRMLAPGQALFEIEKLALSANNVTYAALGELLGYWQFFPAPEGWGRVPAWGYARVVRSEHDDLAVGERVFGYLPMSTHVVMTVDRLQPTSLADASPHRQSLPPAYNSYQRLSGLPPSTPDEEDLNALFRPLYVTSFLIDDLLEERGLLDAEAVILTSASSKTAAGLAFLLHGRTPRPRVIGLTSTRSQAFVVSTGSYDEVLPYARIAELAKLRSSTLVDFAGDATITGEVHRTLRATLGASLRIGATHWEADRDASTLPGPTPEIFFAPDRIRTRVRDWGRERFDARYAAAWSSFIPAVRTWLTLEHVADPASLDAAFGALVDGRSDPARATIVSPKTGAR
jgi:hypothetical protein